MTSAILGQSVPETGDKAPSFTLNAYSGEAYILNQYSDGPLLLAFWFPGCAACQTELPQLEKIYQEYSPRGLQIYAIDITGNTAAGKEFVTQKGLTYPFLDADLDVASAFGIASTPTLVLVGKDGVILEKYVGNHNGLTDRLDKLIPEEGIIASR